MNIQNYLGEQPRNHRKDHHMPAAANSVAKVLNHVDCGHQ